MSIIWYPASIRLLVKVDSECGFISPVEFLTGKYLYMYWQSYESWWIGGLDTEATWTASSALTDANLCLPSMITLVASFHTNRYSVMKINDIDVRATDSNASR